MNKKYSPVISFMLILFSLNVIFSQKIAIYNIDVRISSNKWNQSEFYRDDALLIVKGFKQTLEEKMKYDSVFIQVPEHDLRYRKLGDRTGFHFERALSEGNGISIKYLPFWKLKEAKRKFGKHCPDEYIEIILVFQDFVSKDELISNGVNISIGLLETIGGGHASGEYLKPGYILYNVKTIINIKNNNGLVIKHKEFTCADFSEVLPGSAENEQKYKVECIAGQFTKEIILKSANYAFLKSIMK